MPVSRSQVAGLAACALLLSACGGGSGGNGSASGASSSPTGVASCLQKAGYGITKLPSSELTSGGAENRGPGEVAELLVGMNGISPPSTGSGQTAAIISFFDSAAHAASAPNATRSELLSHADVVGSATVQPWRGLATYAIKASPSHTRAALLSTFRAGLKKIESCIS